MIGQENVCLSCPPVFCFSNANSTEDKCFGLVFFAGFWDSFLWKYRLQSIASHFGLVSTGHKSSSGRNDWKHY